METLVCERIRKVTYDQNNDILYVTFENAKGTSYADEGPFGIEIMRDWNTEEVTGVLIYYPKAQMNDRQKKLESMGFGILLSDFLN